ncbi:ADP-ribosylglycohydrolase family protein [Amycolatopsis ultiminotia]|uniref:ADP-ribosylglycohydrolase family protein n=1 Tax=Amycolatopsis ultiminotia TaxID=543629 RepID=A0ABP6V089_9PSEU
MEYISDEEKNAGLTQEPWGLAHGEIEQAAQTGRAVTALRDRLAALTPADGAALLEVYEEALALPPAADWPYTEPSDPDEIRLALPADDDPQPAVPDLADRVHGAWTGRVIGNTIGKPFEIGPTRETIRGYLGSIGAYPLRGYVPFAEGADRSVLGRWGFEGITEGRISGAVRDDDIDFTVLGLHILETYGPTYTTRDVAREWLSRFPVYQVFTAERNAYQNLVREVPLAEAGSHHNPFREWIGALIRADIFGMVHPGRPRRAALLTLPDALLSHRANGIYGQMWAAALLATAFTAETPEDCVAQSLRHIPAGSRLAAEIRAVAADHAAGTDWEQAIDRITARHTGMNWVHTINNAGALTAAILWGAGDFATTVGLAVQAGLDTDSIGASAGAWAGAFTGFDRLPGDLVRPIEDTYRSGVFGVGDTRISNLADRTLAIARNA